MKKHFLFLATAFTHGFLTVPELFIQLLPAAPELLLVEMSAANRPARLDLCQYLTSMFGFFADEADVTR